MIKKRVPQLREKKPEERDHDPDSLAMALNWDEVADPGDADPLKAWFAGDVVIDVPLGTTEDEEV